MSNAPSPAARRSRSNAPLARSTRRRNISPPSSWSTRCSSAARDEPSLGLEPPECFQPEGGGGLRGAEFLREKRDAELFQHPPKGLALRSRHARSPLGERG